jgi:hypothetical protein
MKLETFYEKSVYICVIIFLFTLLFNFVMELGVYTSVTQPQGLQPGQTAEEKLKEMTKSPEYENGIVMNNIWEVVILGSVVGVGIAILTHNTSIIAVYLFCYVFWAMYVNLISILSLNNFLVGNLAVFVGIGTAGVSIVFIGAVIGMLSGSG